MRSLRALWKPSDVAFRAELTTPQRAVLSVLVAHADESGQCWPSHATIAAASQLGRSTVIRVLSELEELGLVTRDRRRAPRSTLYTVSLLDRPIGRLSQEGQRSAQSGTETGPERDGDRPRAGHELPKELPKGLPKEGGGAVADATAAPPTYIATLVRHAIESLTARPADILRAVQVLSALLPGFEAADARWIARGFLSDEGAHDLATAEESWRHTIVSAALADLARKGRPWGRGQFVGYVYSADRVRRGSPKSIFSRSANALGLLVDPNRWPQDLPGMDALTWDEIARLIPDPEPDPPVRAHPPRRRIPHDGSASPLPDLPW